MASDFRRKEELPDLTEQIVNTYTEVGTINHLGHCTYPYVTYYSSYLFVCFYHCFIHI